ncbi:MAG: tetraether lipid synthase Tes [Methanotrichaceae archaeon]
MSSNSTIDSISEDRIVSSLCPVCLRVIRARIFQEDGAVMIEKCCEEHGDFKDIYWSDAALYRKFMRYWPKVSRIDKSSKSLYGCPFDCGICENHKSGTLLGNIDVTNRCNLSCPVCFADAGGNNDDPTIGQIASMMQVLRDQEPVPCPAIQFSGGEPTLRIDLPDMIVLAKKMGFAQIQVATNGLMLASRLDVCESLVKSGLSTVYLQFDGVTPQPYEAIRGRNLLPEKIRAIVNLRRAGNMSLVLVPTVVKGINDCQIGDIVRFASNNLDIIKGINYQPVSFAGRIDQEMRAAKRITLPDVLALLEDQTDNEISKDDFYPVPFVEPISYLLEAETGIPQPVLTAHPCCGAGTYVYCQNGHLIPITRFLDVEGLLEDLKQEVTGFNGSMLGKLKMKARIIKEVPRFIDESMLPGDLNLKEMILSVFIKGSWESLIDFHSRSLFIGVMHFQDLYNIDLEKLERCAIHYALPDGRLVPFCSHNACYRIKSKQIRQNIIKKRPN